jgi:CRISPR-associated protein Csm4
MKAVKIYFRTPVRVGEAGLGLESTAKTLHSDFLFSVIANALARAGEDVVNFINKVNNGEIRFSSGFPFKDSEYYLPVPLSPNINLKGFIRKKALEDGKIGKEDRLDVESLVHEIPKVTLDRKSATSNIYYVSAVKIKGGGFYFIYDGELKPIKTALDFLKDEGIGGKRNWGLGTIEKYEIEDFNIKTNGDHYMTLSLTFPESLDSVKYWRPIVRSGWVYNKVKRKPKITMASEGSIFSKYDGGRLIDLDEIVKNFSSDLDHKIYVNGKSFLIPVVV